FQKLERLADALEEVGLGYLGKLRFGIVQVIDVDTIDAQILEAPRQLILEEARGHRVASGNDVFRAEYAWLDILTEEVLVGIGGHGVVRREVAAFGRKDDFFARDTVGAELSERGADATFAALEAIVDSGVQNVDPGLDSGDRRRRVASVGGRIGLAEI